MKNGSNLVKIPGSEARSEKLPNGVIWMEPEELGPPGKFMVQQVTHRLEFQVSVRMTLYAFSINSQVLNFLASTISSVMGNRTNMSMDPECLKKVSSLIP